MFKKKVDPKTQVAQWMATFRKEMRSIDSDIRKIEREQAKIKLSIHTSVSRNEMSGAKILAKALHRSNKTVERLHMTKSQMNSMMMQLKEQQSQLKIVDVMSSSTQILKTMSSLVSLPKIAAVSREMAKEMSKAGLIQEMMDDQFAVMEDDDIDDDVDAEVEKVLFEVTAGKLGQLEAPSTGIVRQPIARPEETAEQEAADDELDARIANLAS